LLLLPHGPIICIVPEVAGRLERLASLGLDDAVGPRWALRDIKANRLTLTPVDPPDLRTLINMGYVELPDEEPVVTSSGAEEMEIGD
jgi:hypothetical protein